MLSKDQCHKMAKAQCATHVQEKASGTLVFYRPSQIALYADTLPSWGGWNCLRFVKQADFHYTDSQWEYVDFLPVGTVEI